MSTIYPVAADAARTTVASYTQGSGSLTIASASGFPTPTTSAPILFTVVSAASYGVYPETFCTYQSTGVSGSTLTGLTAIDGVDTAWVAGDIVEMRTCALHLNGPATAVQASIATIAAETSLPNSRQLAAGSNVTLTDNGPRSTLVISAAGGSGGTPGGTSGQIQYNNASAFGGFTLGGDATLVTSTGVFTLASVNTNVGSFGGASSVPSVTVNAKGLVTAASATAVVAPAGTLSGTTLNSTVVTSSLTTVGTIATGAWHGTVIAGTFGGTGINNGTSTITIGGNVTFSGAFTFSGTLTGNTAVTFPTSGTLLAANQTITLSGPVTGSGTTAITTALTNAGITYAKIQNETASTLLGNPTGSAAAPSEITLGAGLSFSGTTLVASGGSGTVTSVTFTGDGTVLSSTPSSAVTTSGTVTAALASAGAYTILGNNTASSATPTYVPATLGQAILTGSTALAASSPSWNYVTGAGTQTLPTAASAPSKFFYFSVPFGSSATTIAVSGSDHIHNYNSSVTVTTTTIGAAQVASFVSDGVSQWYQITPPSWQTQGGGTGATTAPTPGGLIYGTSASIYGSTPAGTAGQIPQSAGSGVPTWTSTPGSGTALTSVTAAAFDSTAALTPVSGTAGTYTWAQPFAGASYKKVIIFLSGYSNTSTSAIVFTTAFVNTPVVAANGTTLTISTLSNTGVTIPISTTQTGFIILEGY